MTPNPIVNIEPEQPDVRIEISVANEGKDGHTPVKGVDYWTDADRQEIVDEVKTQIDVSGAGTVKSVNGNLPDKNGNVIVPPELPPPEDIPIADGELLPFDKVLGVGMDFDSDELSPRWELVTPPGTEAVRFTKQTLNVNQQTQARENIGAQPKGEYASKADVDKLSEEIAFKAENYGLPVLAMNGNCDGMTKENYVPLAFSFIGMSGTLEAKKQGSSSIVTGEEIGGAFDDDVGGLFNFTLKFPEAFEAKEGWGAQKKYVFKADAIDHTHARNLMSCKLWGEMARTRPLANIFDLSKVTGFKTVAGGDVSNKFTIADGVISTTTGSVYNSGHVFMYGQEFTKGVYRVSFKATTAENTSMYIGFSNGSAYKVMFIGIVSGVENTMDFIVVNPYDSGKLIIQTGGGASNPACDVSNIEVCDIVGGRSHFDDAAVSEFVGMNGNDIGAAASYKNGILTANYSLYGYGPAYMTGQTFAKGKYKIALNAYNGKTASVEPNNAVCVGFGKPNGETVSKMFTLAEWTTWEYHEIELDNTIDDAYLFIMPAGGANSANNANMMFKFNGISVTTSIITLPNAGAVDGFPIIVTLNGKYYALGTFNIPKDGWMLGNPKAILCADAHSPATRFEALATLDGDFELEYVEDENNADWVLPSINRAIQAVIDGDTANLGDVGKYIDIPSAIDYFIHTVDEMADDGVDKNYILFTYDGVKWYFNVYDRDTTYGLRWNGKGFNSATGSPRYTAYANRLMILLRAYKKEEIKTRAIELREGIKSEAHVADVFTNFGAGIPEAVLMQNCKRWPLLRSTSESNTAQILNWYRMRFAIVGKEIEAL